MAPGRYWLSVLVLVLATAVAYSVFLSPYVRTFHIMADDFALVLNSARKYHLDPALWVTRGYTSYFVAFPDLPPASTFPGHGTDFCRPVVNATFWLESLLCPGTGPLNLATNLLGLVITLIFFMLFARRETGGNILFLSSALIVYAFSPIWYEAVMLPAFRGSLLMVLFALAAFLLLPPEGSPRQGLRIALSVLCQLASLLSHETGIATPVIAALLFVLRRDGSLARSRLKLVPFFLLPLLCFGALRWTFYGGLGHANALRGWLRMGVHGALVLLAKPFFPWDAGRVTNGELSPRVVIAALMNLGGYALVAYALMRPGRSGRKPLLRVLFCLGAALGVLWMTPRARYMQLAAVFGVLAAIVAVEQIGADARQRWVRRGVPLALVGLAFGELLVYVTSFPHMVAEYEADNRLARVEFEGLQGAIAAARVPTLLLVNDEAGYWGSQAMLEMAAWPNKGRVRRLITVDSYLGEGSPQSSMNISRENEAVVIEILAGPDQHFYFAMVNLNQLGSKFVNQGLGYEMDTVRSYSFTGRFLRRLGKKVDPDDVDTGRRLRVTVPPEVARDGLLIVGFDPRDMSWFSKELLR